MVAQPELIHRAAASNVSSGVLLKAMAAPGAHLRTKLMITSNNSSCSGALHPTTDHDALPRSAQQRRGDHHFLVITAIESDEAGLDADTVLLESDQTPLDRIAHRLRIPGAWNAIRVKADDQNSGRQRRHNRTLWRPAFAQPAHPYVLNDRGWQ